MSGISFWRGKNFHYWDAFQKELRGSCFRLHETRKQYFLRLGEYAADCRSRIYWDPDELVIDARVESPRGSQDHHLVIYRKDNALEFRLDNSQSMCAFSISEILKAALIVNRDLFVLNWDLIALIMGHSPYGRDLKTHIELLKVDQSGKGEEPHVVGLICRFRKRRRCFEHWVHLPSGRLFYSKEYTLDTGDICVSQYEYMDAFCDESIL